MVMTKLFNKFLTVSVAAFSAFSLPACSDKIAGTAEEPNQFALETKSSSSSDTSLLPDSGNNTDSQNGWPNISSSASTPNPATNIPSSSQSALEDSSTVTITPTPSRTDSIPLDGKAGNAEGTPIGNPDTGTSYTLDSYLKHYGITEVTYDDNVLAINKTYDSQLEDVYNSGNANTAKLRTLGLHKITSENASGLGVLFLRTAVTIGGKLYEKDGTISRIQDGCQLYVLNIIDTSPVVHVLTKISKDTIAITEVHDNCDYERRPFDMHVGFLFEYCGELSESPKIERTFLLKETWNCSDVDYDEYTNKKLQSSKKQP